MQNDNYRQPDSFFYAFRHSCLGRLVLTVIILLILSVIAYFTCPTEEHMRAEMDDNIKQCIEERDSVTSDWTETMVKNTRYMFTTADSIMTHPEDLRVFMEFNTMAYYNHSLFSTMYIFNSFHIEGKRCALGIFGLVIPIVDFNDFLLREGPMFKEYERPVQEYGSSTEQFFGDNPDLGGVFEYNGD